MHTACDRGHSIKVVITMVALRDAASWILYWSLGQSHTLRPTLLLQITITTVLGVVAMF